MNASHRHLTGSAIQPIVTMDETGQGLAFGGSGIDGAAGSSVTSARSLTGALLFRFRSIVAVLLTDLIISFHGLLGVFTT